MTWNFRVPGLFSTILLVACCAAQSGEKVERLHHLFDSLAQAGMSFSALVYRDSLLIAEGYGYADARKEVRNTARTAYDIGSLSKQFTAFAISQLMEKGQLSPETRLDAFFPTVPVDKASITVHQLLTHSAGLASVHDRKGDFERMDMQQALARIFAAPLLAPPGTAYNYSNSGYTLLAMIVEHVSGLAFETYIRSHVLDPAGLARTGFTGEHRWPPDAVAVGRGKRKKGTNRPDDWPPTTWATLGNGGMVSTVEDLFTWSRFLFSETGSAERQRMFARQIGTTVSGQPISYGYGWYVYHDERAHVHHGGASNFGFISSMDLYEEERTCVILLSNTFKEFTRTVRYYRSEIEAILYP